MMSALGALGQPAAYVPTYSTCLQWDSPGKPAPEPVGCVRTAGRYLSNLGTCCLALLCGSHKV